MATLALIAHPSSTHFTNSQFKFKFKLKSNKLIITTRQILTPKPPISIIFCSNRSPQPISPLNSIKPYIQSEWKSILNGWICSGISVFALSKAVPRIGKFTSVMSSIDAVKLRDEGFVIGSLFLIRMICGYLQQAFLWEAALSAVCKIRADVFERVLERDLGFFEGGNGVSSGDIAYRITAEASDVADTVYSLLNTIVPSTLQLSAMAAQMLVVSPSLSLISAFAIPSMALAIAYIGRTLHKISKEANLSSSAISAYLNEVLPSILFVKANNAELCESIRFKNLASIDLSKRLKKKKMKALVPQVMKILFFGVLLILCVGSLLVSGGSFDCSSVVSFLTSLVLLIEPIQDVGKSYNELKQGEPAIERLFELSKFKAQVIEKSDAIDLESVSGDVKFSEVSFRYNEGSPSVLNGLNLHIKAGETVALVGPSGGGKTTLVKLLLRLYDPTSGSVLIDDHNVQNIRVASLRKHVGLVSQDTTLFSGTVAENIGYRDRTSKIDMEKVEAAARTANADEFIQNLPHSYLTNIGPRGSILSGGQRQRLAIARAVYQDPSILIMDEATSALDSRSELLVRQAVHRLMENRTVLVIAHRLETVLMAERVLHLDGGKLTEISRSTLLAGQWHDDTLAPTGFPFR